MKVIRITNSVFATNAGGVAEEVLKAGQELPVDDAEGQRQIGRNNAEVVDAAEPAAPEAPADEQAAQGDAAADAGKKRGKKAE